MKKKQTDQSNWETEKSKIDLEKAEQLKAILDSDVFNEAVEELKADLLIRTTVSNDDNSVLQVHKQVQAIDLVTQRLHTLYNESSGEYK